MLNRRTWLNWGAGLALGSSAVASAAPRLDGYPATAFELDDPAGDASREGYRFAGDFDPAAAVWLSYDAGHAELSLGLAAALAPHVPLKFFVRDQAAEAEARMALTGDGFPLGSDRVKPVTFIQDPLASYFMRDMTVFTRAPEGRLGVVDFRWSEYGVPGWCARRWRGQPGTIASCSASADYSREELPLEMARLTGARAHPSSVALEGGGFETNGRGLLIANRALLRTRNPGVSRARLEAALLALPGLRKVIWLPEGLAEDVHLRGTITGSYVAWGSGGHTDQFVRFADPCTVLLAWPDDADVAAHPVARLTRARMQVNFDILRVATDVSGRPLKVVKVPMPRPVQRPVVVSADADTVRSEEWTAEFFRPEEGRRNGDVLSQVATASYLNFVVANGVVVLPDYLPHGTPRALQERVRRTFEKAFPKREIRFVDAITANWVGGGAHCATLNEPLGLPQSSVQRGERGRPTAPRA